MSPTPDSTRRHRRARGRRTMGTWIGPVAVLTLAAAACGASDPATAPPPTPTSTPTSTTTTPTTTVAGAPQTSSPGAAPADYRAVGPAHAAQRATILATGREAVAALLAGDIATVRSAMTAELRSTVPEEAMGAVLTALGTDRVHFEDPLVGAVFDGQLLDDTISGTVNQGGVGTPFTLRRTTLPDPSSPLVGTWEGLLGSEAAGLALVATVWAEGDQLDGTIDVPEQGLSHPMQNVGYEPTVEIGNRIAETVVVRSPDLAVYAVEHAWGPWTLAMVLQFDGDGDIAVFEEPLGLGELPADPAADYVSDTVFRLPFDGIWSVGAGGPSRIQNHHVVAPNQRHGYDLVVWKDGAVHDGDGTANEDYWAWEEPVLAPADGIVVAVLDGIDDNPNPPEVSPTATHVAGNHVVVRTGPDEYLFIAHFRKESIRVVEGDQVSAGDVLGLTGNSGNSSDPHIHIHLQDEPDFFSPTATGLPLPFTGYLADGEPVAVGVLAQGQLVQHGAATG